jgi:hypothetical protein
MLDSSLALQKGWQHVLCKGSPCRRAGSMSCARGHPAEGPAACPVLAVALQKGRQHVVCKGSAAEGPAACSVPAVALQKGWQHVVCKGSPCRRAASISCARGRPAEGQAACRVQGVATQKGSQHVLCKRSPCCREQPEGCFAASPVGARGLVPRLYCARPGARPGSQSLRSCNKVARPVSTWRRVVAIWWKPTCSASMQGLGSACSSASRRCPGRGGQPRGGAGGSGGGHSGASGSGLGAGLPGWLAPCGRLPPPRSECLPGALVAMGRKRAHCALVWEGSQPRTRPPRWRAESPHGRAGSDSHPGTPLCPHGGTVAVSWQGPLC